MQVKTKNGSREMDEEILNLKDIIESTAKEKDQIIQSLKQKLKVALKQNKILEKNHRLKQNYVALMSSQQQPQPSSTKYIIKYVENETPAASKQPSAVQPQLKGSVKEQQATLVFNQKMPSSAVEQQFISKIEQSPRIMISKLTPCPPPRLKATSVVQNLKHSASQSIVSTEAVDIQR